MNDEMKMILETFSAQVKEIKTEVNDLKTVVLDMQHSRRFKGKIYGWVGGVLVALLSTDAFLDLITNHIRL